MAIDRRIAATLLVALGLAACTTSGDARTSPSPSVTTATTRPSVAKSTDVRLLERYLAALDRGDVEAADSLRCKEAKVPAARLEQFQEEFDRFVDGAGSISLGPAVSAPAPDGSDRDLLTVFYEYGGVQASLPVEIFVVTEGGERRLCTTADLPTEPDVNEFDAIDLGPSKVPIGDLLPELDAPGFTHMDDEAPAPVAARHERATAGRRWRHQPASGAAVFLTTYETVADARIGAKTLIANSQLDVVETIDVPGGLTPFGVRIAGYSWLWVQAPDIGPYLDRIVFQMDDTVALIQNSMGEPGDGNAVALDLTSQTAALAGFG